MAHTRLFGDLQRAALLARESLRTGESAQEVVERAAHERAMSRRRFLGLSAAGVAALALDGAVRRGYAQPAVGVDPVIIIGAGIAGLTAAHRLRQKSVPVRIFEAQERTGGRMWSLRNHFADGQVAELGGELIDSGHTQIIRLAGELGIPLDDLSHYHPQAAQDVWFFRGRHHSEHRVVEAFRPVLRAIKRDMATIPGGDVTAAEPNGGEKLDRTPLSEWMDRNVGHGWFHSLLEVAYVTEYGLELDRQSSLNLLIMLADEHAGTFRPFGDSDERYHVRGGNDLIPGALAARLHHDIETATVLEAVSRRADGAYVCSFQRGGGRFEAAARHVVLAIPFTLLREVRLDESLRLPARKRLAIDTLGYGTNAKLMLGFSARPWLTRDGSNGSSMSDLPYQLTWETSRMQPGRAGILTNFTGGRHGVELGEGTPADQARKAVAELERVFPGISAYRTGMTEARFHWPTFPWTRGSYASYLPGQWTGIRGVEGQAVDGLHFAGEHCSLEAQGFMEGGCETGEAAAAEVLAALGARTAATAAPELVAA